MNKVIENLEQTLRLFDKNSEVTVSEKEEDFEVSFSKLKSIRTYEVDSTEVDEEKKRQLIEESQLVIDQLIWMVSLSEKILKISTKVKVERQKSKLEKRLKQL